MTLERGIVIFSINFFFRAEERRRNVLTEPFRDTQEETQIVSYLKPMRHKWVLQRVRNKKKKTSRRKKQESGSKLWVTIIQLNMDRSTAWLLKTEAQHTAGHKLFLGKKNKKIKQKLCLWLAAEFESRDDQLPMVKQLVISIERKPQFWLVVGSGGGHISQQQSQYVFLVFFFAFSTREEYSISLAKASLSFFQDPRNR